MVCFTDREIRMIMNDMEEETQSFRIRSAQN